MTTQQDRRSRETVRRTSRHRETGKPEDHRRDAAAESSAAKHRRFAGGAPAAQQGPSDAYSEGPSLLSGTALLSGVVPTGAAVGTRSTDTDGLAPGPFGEDDTPQRRHVRVVATPAEDHVLLEEERRSSRVPGPLVVEGGAVSVGQ